MDNDIPKANRDQMKELLLEQLRKVHNVQLAVDRVGISRATFYNWKSADSEFASDVEKAIVEGITVRNDIVEVALVNSAQQGKVGAQTLWLKSNHPRYGGGKYLQTKKQTVELSAEQKKIIEQALKFARIEYDDIQSYGTDNTRETE